MLIRATHETGFTPRLKALLRAPRRLGWFFFIFIIVSGLFFFILRTPPVWTLDIGGPNDSHFSSGFFQAETNAGTTFRWSGPDTQLLLHGTGPDPLKFRLRINGDQLDRADHRLTLKSHDQPLATLAVAPGWRIYTVLLPAGATMGTGLEATPIALVSATHRPGPLDGRDLGVPVDWVQVAPLPRLAGDVMVPLARALLLVWGLALLAGGLWWLEQVVLPQRPRYAWVRVGGLTGSATLGLLWWAYTTPYTLAWAIPPTPWVFGLTVVLLLQCRPSVAPPPPRITQPWSLWLGMGLVAAAQVLFSLQWQVTLGMVLAVGGLALLQRDVVPTEANAPLGGVGLPLTQRQAMLLLGAICLVALGLRFYRITELPYGLWRDEARHGLIALHILADSAYRPIYVAADRVNMPALIFYPFALAIKLWGVHLWSMRPLTALAGALTVLPLYGLVRRLIGRLDVALLAAAFLAISSWHLSISRFSFPTIFDPLFGLTGLWLLLVGLDIDLMPTTAQRPRSSRVLRIGALLGAGAGLGLAVQTYHTGRVVPGVAAVLALAVLLRTGWRTLNRAVIGRWLRGVALVILGLVLVTGPLLIYALSQPSAYNDRVNGVFLLSNEALRGRAPLAALDEAVGRHVLMFNVFGDSNGRHHAPNRPMLDVLTGLGFLVGCAFLLRRWRDWRSLFLLAALGMSLLPSMLAVESPHAMRSIGGVVFAAIIAALGWVELGETLAQARRRVGGVPQPHKRIIAAFMVVGIALGLNVWTYFVTMPVNPEVWLSFYPVQTQVGEYVRKLADERGVQAVQQVYLPAALFDNAVTSYLVADLPVQTFDSTTLSAPAAPGALFIFSGYASASDVAQLAPWLGAAPSPLLYGPDLPNGAPSFVVYEVINRKR